MGPHTASRSRSTEGIRAVRFAAGVGLRGSAAALSLACAAGAGCTRHEPPGWDPDAATTKALDPAGPRAEGSRPVAPTGSNLDVARGASRAEPSLASPDLDAMTDAKVDSATPFFADDADANGSMATAGGPVSSALAFDTDAWGKLPQTRDRPALSNDALRARFEGLWRAIVDDDPLQADPFFFPLAAYEQVKDVAKPAADWRFRLHAAYARDIHDLHAQLAHRGPDVVFVGGVIPSERARWVEPGEEYNKLGYYRVFGSELRYRTAGRDHSFRIASLISWRGEWFVVHLNAVK